jgi:manganese/zinc/iron transport system ATP- binding protein
MQSYALEIKNLTVAYQDTPVLWQVNATIPHGVLLAIVGPNGAGKTTLLKSMLGLIKPVAGTIALCGGTFKQNIHKIAYVPQRTSVDWDFPATVFDVVLMGRYRHMGWFKRPSQTDYDEVHIALAQVGMHAYADRHISHLSGGQQQRIFLARALVQHADIYMLDEPFIGIDSATEHTMVQIFKQLCALGKTILIVHHDLQTLHQYFDWMWLVNKRSIVCGPIVDVLRQEYIQAAYGNANVCIRYPHDV